MKNYIWDFDGMLFDSYPHITQAFLHMMSDIGRSADYAEVKSLLEITFSEAYEHYGITTEQRALHHEYEHDYGLKPEVVPFPHTVETLKAIHERGCRHFLYTHRGNETSQYYLKKYGIAELFDGFVDSSMNFPNKPAPDAVEWICREYGLDKSETVMIGDREIDVLSGKNAGVYGCLYTLKESPETAADFVVNDIIQIKEI